MAWIQSSPRLLYYTEIYNSLFKASIIISSMSIYSDTMWALNWNMYWLPVLHQILCWMQSQFNHSVMPDSLRPDELQQARLPCPSPTPRTYSNMSITLVMPSNNLILYCPLLLPPSIFPSVRVFSNESVLSIRWPKYWSFSFSISHSNEYSGLISFRIAKRKAKILNLGLLSYQCFCILISSTKMKFYLAILLNIETN